MNKNTVLSLKILTHAIEDFINIFVSLYFLQVNEGNLFKLVIYNMTFCIMIPIVFLMTGRSCKSGRILWVLRSGLFMTFIYFIVMLVMGKSMPEHYILMGMLYGLKEGLYWGAFNILECEGVENSQRRALNGAYLVVKNLVNILFPVILGSVISSHSFAAGISVMAVLTGAGFLFSLRYRDMKRENRGTFRPFMLFPELRKDKNLSGVCIYHIFKGMIYSSGAFRLLTTVYILRMCGDSFTAGWVTALGSMVPMLFGFLLAKVLDTGRKMSSVNNVLTAVMMASTVLMIMHPAPWVVILFYFTFGIYKDAEGSIDSVLRNNVANLSDTVKANKSEYSLMCELWLLAGRVYGYLLLAGYAIHGSSLFLWTFLPAFAGICICFNRLLKRVLVR